MTRLSRLLVEIDDCMPAPFGCPSASARVPEGRTRAPLGTGRSQRVSPSRRPNPQGRQDTGQVRFGGVRQRGAGPGCPDRRRPTSGGSRTRPATTGRGGELARGCDCSACSRSLRAKPHSPPSVSFSPNKGLTPSPKSRRTSGWREGWSGGRRTYRCQRAGSRASVRRTDPASRISVCPRASIGGQVQVRPNARCRRCSTVG